MSELLEAGAELVFGSTGILVFHVLGDRDRTRSSAAYVAVGLVTWCVIGGVIGGGIAFAHAL